MQAVYTTTGQFGRDSETFSKNHHHFSGNVSHKAAKARDLDNDARPSLPERSRVRIVQIKRD